MHAGSLRGQVVRLQAGMDDNMKKDLNPHACPPLSADEVPRLQAQRATIIDVRPMDEFMKAHIVGSYSFSLEDTSICAWVARLIERGSSIVLVGRDSSEAQGALDELRECGRDAGVAGYLQGGMEACSARGLPLEQSAWIEQNDLRASLAQHIETKPVLIDVRTDGEWAAGHIEGAQLISNMRLQEDTLPWDVEQPLVVYCQHGGRSVVGLSVLRRKGYQNVSVLKGGYEAWVRAGN